MPKLAGKNKHLKDMCYNENGLSAQNINTILDLTVNPNGRIHVMVCGGKRIFEHFDHFKFCIDPDL